MLWRPVVLTRVGLLFKVCCLVEGGFLVRKCIVMKLMMVDTSVVTTGFFSLVLCVASVTGRVPVLCWAVRLFVWLCSYGNITGMIPLVRFLTFLSGSFSRQMRHGVPCSILKVIDFPICHFLTLPLPYCHLGTRSCVASRLP